MHACAGLYNKQPQKRDLRRREERRGKDLEIHLPSGEKEVEEEKQRSCLSLWELSLEDDSPAAEAGWPTNTHVTTDRASLLHH